MQGEISCHYSAEGSRSLVTHLAQLMTSHMNTSSPPEQIQQYI